MGWVLLVSYLAYQEDRLTLPLAASLTIGGALELLQSDLWLGIGLAALGGVTFALWGVGKLVFGGNFE